MAEAAINRGYDYLAITDHSKAVAVAHGLDEKRISAQLKAIDAYNDKLKKKRKKFRLIKGGEVDIRADGTLDYPDDILEELDCVVGAVHSGFTMSTSPPFMRRNFFLFFFDKLKKKRKKFRLIKGGEVDIRADGTLDYPDDILEELDCVVGAV